ncbi:MAG: hypothetical protein K2N35_03450 [Muribaculaceae bacterium]|nr:hypothetical protein [Muribaculaceae bacterium]
MNDTVTVDFRWRERYNFESKYESHGNSENSVKLPMPVYLALIQGGNHAVESYIRNNFIIYDPDLIISDVRMFIS